MNGGQKYNGSIDCFRQVLRKEGWEGLYRGLQSAVFGMGTSSLVYFYWYSLLKEFINTRLNKTKLSTLENIATASIAGTLKQPKACPCNHGNLSTNMRRPLFQES